MSTCFDVLLLLTLLYCVGLVDVAAYILGSSLELSSKIVSNLLVESLSTVVLASVTCELVSIMCNSLLEEGSGTSRTSLVTLTLSWLKLVDVSSA